MTLAVALAFGTLLVLWLAPSALTAAVQRQVEPQAALTAWMLLVISTFLTLVAAVVVSLLPGHGPARWIVGLLQHCWVAVSHGEVPRLDALSGLAGFTLLALTSIRVLLAATRRVHLQRGTHRKHVNLLRGIARVEPGRFPLLWLEYPEPVAYSLASGTSRPVIVASRGLVDRLSAPDLAAVLDHERAHLRGRHHLLVGLAEALAAALPRLPLMRASPVLVRTLVELAADRVAARLHGPATVRAALVAIGSAGTPMDSLAMGRDAVSIRLRWLDATKPTGRIRRMATAALAGISAALAPAAVGATALAVAGLLTCASVAVT